MGWFLPALFSAGTSLLGGVLNKNAQKKQQQAAQKADQQAQEFAKENSIVDLSKLRDTAKKAGFNPLTALMAGAGSPAASNYQSQYQPQLSSGSFIAEAMQRGADTYFNTVAEQDAQATAIRREAEDRRRWEAEMAADATKQSFGYALTNQQAYAPPVQSRGPAVGSAAIATSGPSAGTSGSDDMVAPSSLPIRFGGRDFKPSGDYSDAEAAESRYGEIAGEILGIGSLTHDAGRAARDGYDYATRHTFGQPVTRYETPKMFDRREFQGPMPDEYKSPFGTHGPHSGHW